MYKIIASVIVIVIVVIALIANAGRNRAASNQDGENYNGTSDSQNVPQQ